MIRFKYFIIFKQNNQVNYSFLTILLYYYLLNKFHNSKIPKYNCYSLIVDSINKENLILNILST